MKPWMNRKKNWLGKKRKETENIPEPEPEYGITYQIIRCPRCSSERVRCYKTIERTRYYKCLEVSCEFRFKAVPAD